MKTIDEKMMKKIHKKHQIAKKDFKNRCFFVLETLAGGDIVCEDIEKLKTDVYQIAHIGTQTCGNKHEDWVANMEKLFKAFEKGGL